MRCFCKILRISYKDHVTNGEVCADIQQAIGPFEHLLTIVKRSNLKKVHFSLFSNALWDLTNSRPVSSLMSSRLLFLYSVHYNVHCKLVRIGYVYVCRLDDDSDMLHKD